MKIKRLLLVIAIGFAAVSQLSAQTSLAGGVVYGTSIDRPGLQIRSEFNLTDELIAAPNLSLYVPRIVNWPYYKAFSMLFDLSLDVHYIIFEEDPFRLYPLAGLTFGLAPSIHTYTSGYIGDQVGASLNPGIGVNIGAGAQFDLSDDFMLFGEIKYSIARYHQLVLTAGAFFRIIE